MKKIIYLLFLLTLSCLAQNTDDISVSKLHELTANKIFTGKIIDVRTPQEQLETGIIKGAAIKNAHSQDLDEYISKLDKKETYYVYCASGGRSSQVAKKMRIKGLKVINVEGGMNAWKAKKFETEKITKDRFK